MYTTLRKWWMAHRSENSGSLMGRARFPAAFAFAAVVLSGCAPSAMGPSPSGLVSPSPSQASSAPTEASAEEPLPVPAGETLLAVLDLEVVKPKVNAEEAVALIWADAEEIFPESPRVQLVRLAFRDPYSAFGPVWTGWIILYTELPGTFTGGPYLGDPHPVPSHTAVYTWFYVSPDGEVMGETQVGYETVESVPSLPPEPAN